MDGWMILIWIVDYIVMGRWIILIRMNGRMDIAINGWMGQY